MGPVVQSAFHGDAVAPFGGQWTGALPDASEFERFCDYVHRHSGIHLEAERAEALRISVTERAWNVGCMNLDEYFTLLATDGAEFRELLNLVTINETSFFRFGAQFDVLAESVLPELLAAKEGGDPAVRVWSAGCSSGEEPYSIAMTLLDAVIGTCSGAGGGAGVGLGVVPFEVVGTDISTDALDRAQRGVYPKRALLAVPDGMRHRYFEQVEAGYRVTDEVRELVDLGYHNLAQDPLPAALAGNWDVIFCRNVTIYFRLEMTRRVVHRFFEALNPGGYLFVGHSETLAAISDEFEPVEIDGVFLYRKPKESHPIAAGAPHAGAAARARRRRPGASARATSGAPGASAVPAPAAPTSARPAPRPSTDAVAQLDAHLAAARAHADAGDFAAAVVSCRRALNANPLSDAARFILGVIYERLGDVARAVEEFDRVTRVNPDFVLAHFNLARLYHRQGALREAAREYAGALAALVRSPDGAWTVFLDGFTPVLLEQSCARALAECKKVTACG